MKLEKLESLLEGTLSNSATTVPIVAAILSIDIGTRYGQPDLTPRQRNAHLLRALAEHLRARASSQAVALIFEDAHWIDPSSQELLNLLVDTIADHRMLLLVTHRPEYEPPWPGGGHIIHMPLGRFDKSVAAELVHGATGGRKLPDAVFAEIIARTDGVPLFVEEMTRSVMESDVLNETEDGLTLIGPLSALVIPETLRDSLMARLDRLGTAKGVAQTGACIGREFSQRLIAAITALDEVELKKLLNELITAGLITQTGMGRDAVYTFSHALVQGAAYDSLLRRERRRFHLAIANAIEAASVPTVAAEFAVLGAHYADGGEALRALSNYRRAAEIATETFAVLEALALYDAALIAGEDLALDDHASALMDLRKSRAALFFMIGRFVDARDENRAYLALARAAGDRQRECDALAGLGYTSMWAEDFDAASESSKQAIALAEEVGETSILGMSHLTGTYIAAVSGDLNEGGDQG